MTGMPAALTTPDCQFRLSLAPLILTFSPKRPTGVCRSMSTFRRDAPAGRLYKGCDPFS